MPCWFYRWIERRKYLCVTVELAVQTYKHRLEEFCMPVQAEDGLFDLEQNPACLRMKKEAEIEEIMNMRETNGRIVFEDLGRIEGWN